MTIFTSKPKFAIPTISKCGEISYSNISQQMNLHCVFCGSDFVMLNNFFKHIKKCHLKINKQPGVDSPFKCVAAELSSKSQQGVFTILEKSEEINADLQKDPLNIEESFEKDEAYIDYSELANIKVEAISEMQEQITQSSDASSSYIKTEICEAFVQSSGEDVALSEDSDEELCDSNSTKKKTDNRLTRSHIVLELIEQLKKHTIVWNKSHEDFHKQAKRIETYGTITTALQALFPKEEISKEWVQKNVNLLLSKLRRTVKDASFRFGKSMYFESLRFLHDYYRANSEEKKRSKFKPNAAGLYACTLCSKELRSENILYYHMLRHNKDYQIKCDVCAKPFYNESEVRRHMTTHTQERSHICEICGKAFSIGYELSLHKKRHTNQRDYKCTVCPKAFYGSDKLKEHMATHSEQYTEKCETCGRLFKTRSNLKIHMKIHNPVKGYPCLVCGKAFSQSSQRSMHMRCHK